MENKNINTAKALPAPEAPKTIARSEAKCNTCGYKNRKQRPELSIAAANHRVNVADAGKLGRLTISDIQALFGSAAAERLLVSRMTLDDGSAADAASRTTIRRNLVDSLLAAGYTVTSSDYETIMDGDYATMFERVCRSGKTAAIDAVDIANAYEKHWEYKRERQVERGARAFREDKSLDKFATGAAVAYMVANAAAVVTKLASISKKLAK